MTVVLSPFLISVLLNEWRRDSFAEQLYSLELPAGAELVSRSSEVGVFLGMGNHCDYQAKIVVMVDPATAASTELLKAFDKNFRSARLPTKIVIPRILADPPYYYTIILEDGPYGANFNFRCH